MTSYNRNYSPKHFGYMDKAHEALASVMQVSYELNSLAHALDRIGNQELAKEMWMHAKELQICCDDIRNDMSDELNNKVRVSELNTGSILATAFAMGGVLSKEEAAKTIKENHERIEEIENGGT